MPTKKSTRQARSRSPSFARCDSCGKVFAIIFTLSCRCGRAGRTEERHAVRNIQRSSLICVRALCISLWHVFVFVCAGVCGACVVCVCGVRVRVQIYAMRQAEKTNKDTSHIAKDYNSMHKTPDAAAQEAAAESRAMEARRVEIRLHTKRKAALLMAQLHKRVPGESEQEVPKPQQYRLCGWGGTARGTSRVKKAHTAGRRV